MNQYLPSEDKIEITNLLTTSEINKLHNIYNGLFKVLLS